MRPRLKAQNQVKYANRSRLDRDLMILQRALKKVPDWCEGRRLETSDDYRSIRERKCKHLFINPHKSEAMGLVTTLIRHLISLLVMLCHGF